MKGTILIAGIQSVTKEWTKQRKAEERQANARLKRHDMWLGKPKKVNFKEACAQFMEGAYLKASANGALPATTRQVYYAIREDVQQIVGKPLDSQYFSQTILPDYVLEHNLDWDITYDDRGHFQEPHDDGTIIGLGTLSVRNYIKTGRSLDIATLKSTPMMVTPKGPGYRYNAILFAEKEGFLPLLEAARIGERYDLGLMSTKGNSVTAARKLADHICSSYNIPLLVLRDFDRVGFLIAAIFQRATRRYQFENQITVIDLGLRLQDKYDYNLPSEAFSEDLLTKSPRKFRDQLRRNRATFAEIDFLAGGQRVELNAFTSDQFIEWLEGKLQGLQAQGVLKKVVPGLDVLEEVYRANIAGSYFEKHSEKVADAAWKQAKEATLPADLMDRIKSILQDDPALSWDKAIQQIIGDAQGASS